MSVMQRQRRIYKATNIRIRISEAYTDFWIVYGKKLKKKLKLLKWKY